MSEVSNTSLIVDLWDVPDGNQQFVLERLRVLAEGAARLPGFVECGLYQSINHRKVLIFARFASVADRQHALDDPEVTKTVREVRALANQDMSPYELVEEFRAPGLEPGHAAGGA